MSIERDEIDVCQGNRVAREPARIAAAPDTIRGTMNLDEPSRASFFVMNARTTARMVRLTESCRFIHQVRVGRRPMFGYIIRRMEAKAQADDAYLDRAIGRYSPAVAATARAGLKKLRERFPGARQLVFERRQSLPIGFAPAERGSPVFSLVL